jgi:FG-GAP-like repeat
MDGISDIAVADYNQNLHVFILDALGNVKESQTSKINTKPRDITIFDWNQDGYNDILIADGGSGLDIKLNQLKPADPTTPPPLPLLATKFKYEYVTGTDRIAKKTEIDIVKRGSSPAFDLTRQTISTFDQVTGNLTSIKVIGTDNSTTAQTSTSYTANGSIEWITDANGHQTHYTYYDSGSKQVK